ncbi:hypothetical protein P4G96_05355 [Bacillus cereus]|nr:hypothetical protein [Bacillus cereus]MEB8665802.1 hypothetical protein [Bacillus cereus]
MNGVLLATRIMKGHEIVKKCAEVKRKLYEMNRKASDTREVS